MSTRSDHEIKTSEAFFNIPDVSDIDLRRFVVKNDQWFAQIFKANGTEINKIFFMCDNTEGLELSLYKANYTLENGNKIFNIGQIITSVIHDVDANPPFIAVNSNNSNSAKWYYPNWFATPQIDDYENSYYAIVFKTTTDKTPSLYWTMDYRSSVFSQIIGWDGNTWSNANITTVVSGKINTGAVCIGYVGNDLQDSTLDSGSLVIGGRDFARRGYPVYLIVENYSSQNEKIIVDFSLMPPVLTTDGSENETNQSMMKWYRFPSNTLPNSSNLGLIKSDIVAELNDINNFVIYIQPDKLSPLAEPFFPSEELDLNSNSLGFTPIYGYSGVNSEGLFDSSSNFAMDYWSVFSRDTRIFNDDNNQRFASYSCNADYIDFSMEDPDGDFDLFDNIKLTEDTLGIAQEKQIVRGFNKGVFYKDKYILFSKNLGAGEISGLGIGSILCHVYDKKTSYSYKNSLNFIDSYISCIDSDSCIFSVHSVINRKINNKDTLFFVFQVMRSDSLTFPWFLLGYYNGDFAEGSIDIQLINFESAGAGDITGELGHFSTNDEGSIDSEKFVKIIEPKNISAFFISVSGETYGLATWRINDSDILSSSYIAKIIHPNYGDIRGICNGSIDVGVDFILYDGDTTYLGVRTENSNVFASIYSTTDFITFEQLFYADIISSSSIRGFSFSIVNNRIPFMHKIGNILHVWMSSGIFSENGNPIHVAINIKTKEWEILRKFPIEDDGDSNYSEVPTISDLAIFNHGKNLKHISSGCLSGNIVYIVGSEKIEYNDLNNETLPTLSSCRWLSYDCRILNNYPSFEIVSGKGRYNGKTISNFDYDNSAKACSNYPALSPDLSTFELNPRVSIYCGSVLSASSESYGLENDNRNIPDNIFYSGGITYLTSRNYNFNFDILKTYGVKELPENWGKTFKESNINSYTQADLDKANYNKVFANAKSMSFISRRSVPVIINDVVFMSEMKYNEYSYHFYSILESNIRNIIILKKSKYKPQAISAVYSVTSKGTDSEKTKLSSTLTSDTALTIKGAQTLEDLFFNPDFVEFVPLSFDTSLDENELFLISKIFNTDIESNFFRIESTNLMNDSSDIITSIKLKNLTFSDVDPSDSFEGHKNVIVNGLLKSNENCPENIIKSYVNIDSNGEIIVDFTNTMYVDKISFTASFASKDFTTNEKTEFEISAIFAQEKINSGDNIVSPEDWTKIRNNAFYGTNSNKNDIVFDNISEYIEKIKIKIISLYSFKIDNFKVYGFIPKDSNIETFGIIKSPKSIFFDDVFSLIDKTEENKAKKFAIFESNNSSITVDLEDSYPISRIALNTYGDGDTSNRTLTVETWDGISLDSGNPVYENVFTGSVKNYDFSIVKWVPRRMNESRNVEVEFLDSSTLYISNDLNIGDFLLDYNNISNNSDLISKNGLSGWSFKPSLFDDRSLSVISSQSMFETVSNSDFINKESDGLIVLNCQMDEDGPFSSEISENSIGLLENKVNIDFSVKKVRKIRVSVKNQNNDNGNIRINGLRLFTPVKDSSGMAIMPVNFPEWNIKLNFGISSE